MARGGERGRVSGRVTETRERETRETRERRTPSTSATRFNYTLQTHDMSKSYTSYRLCHLLKVSSRAPRSRHRCSAARPLLSGALRKHIGRKARNIRTKSWRKERRRGKRGCVPQIDTVAALRVIKATTLSFFGDSLFYSLCRIRRSFPDNGFLGRTARR